MSANRWGWCWAVVLGLVVAACDGSSPPPVGTDGSVGACTRDTECDDGRFCNGEESCSPLSPSADARGCVPDVAPCMAGQICDESAERCETECAVTEDADDDGVSAIECGGLDCDDADPFRAPTFTEVCDVDDRDEDCEPTTFGDRDVDGDGSVDALCCNGAVCGDDCDDLRPGTRPGVPEVCDGFDNDCNDVVDEGVLVAVWPDGDFDLHGDEDAVTVMRCAGAFGFATVGDDCNDGIPSIHPAQVEICDALDNDCDDLVDEAPAATTWYTDADGDGFGSSDPATSRVSCTPLPGYSLRPTDCDDTRAGVSPATPERCDGLDNDCNGRPDFLLGANDTEDDDTDGHADLRCPSGDDCDDRDPTSLPDAIELCDRRDNDCNGTVDDGTAMGMWWPDRDGDTYGDAAATPVASCSYVRGHMTRARDCDDSSAARRPGAAETCNGSDDDCDGLADEGSDRSPYYLDVDGDGLGAGTPLLACVAPVDRVANALDCDDADHDVGASQLWFVDADGDTYGDPARSSLSCTAIADRIVRGGDCDDDDATTRPMGTETCGGADEDCDGTTDEDPAASASCTIPGADAVCTAGACTVSMCEMGFGDCNTSTADGCESDLLSSAATCGACGTSCDPGERCRAGECATITAIAGGRQHTCALLGTGHVGCWGYNANGELGRGSFVSSARAPTSMAQFVQIWTGALLDDAIAVSSHPQGAFTCALRAGGTVVCWGDNSELQCGADAPAATAARAATIPGITNAIAITTGAEHACAVLATGEVRCWGSNSNGQLSSGGTTPVRSGTPLVVVENEGGMRPLADAVEVSAGNYFTCFLHASRTRVSCAGQQGSGAGWSGQLGRGTLAAGSYPIADDVLLPAGTAVRRLRSGGVASYDTGTCVLPMTGAPICWGINQFGQFGPGGTTVATPRVIEPLLFASATDLWLGSGTLCVEYVNESFGPRVACLGSNASRELGIDQTLSSTSIAIDVVTEAADGTRGFLTSLRAMAAGNGSTCGLLESGGVTCWGVASSERFGDGDTATRPRVFVDRLVPGLP